MRKQKPCYNFLYRGLVLIPISGDFVLFIKITHQGMNRPPRPIKMYPSPATIAPITRTALGFHLNVSTKGEDMYH